MSAAPAQIVPDPVRSQGRAGGGDPYGRHIEPPIASQDSGRDEDRNGGKRQSDLLGEHHRFVPVFARGVGARLTEVKIQNIERPSGRSNYGLSRTLNVFLDMLFLAFYVHYLDRPIRLFGRIALATLAVAVVITAALAWQYLAYDVAVVRERSGWFTLALVLYVAGVQFALFGVVSELLVRMYFYPARVRPYSIRRVIGSARPQA